MAEADSALAVSSFGGLALVKKDGTVSQKFPLVERRYLFGRCGVYCTMDEQSAMFGKNQEVYVFHSRVPTKAETFCLDSGSQLVCVFHSKALSSGRISSAYLNTLVPFSEFFGRVEESAFELPKLTKCGSCMDRVLLVGESQSSTSVRAI
jgi:hypothetical protein